MSIHEQARAEAEKRWPATYGQAAWAQHVARVGAFVQGAEWAATRTRVVATVTELDALPDGSVLAIHHEDGSGPSVYVNDRDEGWIMANERIDKPSVGEVDAEGVRRDWVGNRRGPLTVLYDPEETR